MGHLISMKKNNNAITCIGLIQKGMNDVCYFDVAREEEGEN
jgi:hypothetical protein